MLRKVLWATVAVMLASCRTVPVHTRGPFQSQSWETRRPQLQARDRFELKGRVAVATGSDGIQRASALDAGWQNRRTCHLMGRWVPAECRLRRMAPRSASSSSRGDRLDNDAARAELTNRLGFDPPIDSLRYWVLGVPEPGTRLRSRWTRSNVWLLLNRTGGRSLYTDYMSRSWRVAPVEIDASASGGFGCV